MKLSLITAALLLSGIIYYSCEKNSENGFIINTEITDNFPSEEGKIIIHVSNVPELMATTRLTIEGNAVVIIKDGTYELPERLWLTGDNLIYRSESGNRDKVIIKGKGMTGSVGWIFNITGSNFALKDVSIGEVRYNGILVHGEKNTDNTYIQNVRFFNIRHHMLKVQMNNEFSDMRSDFGTIENCKFEYTEEHAFDYTCGGILIQGGKGWKIRGNTFKNISSPVEELTDGAINFRDNALDCNAERNIIINCDRGILFGYGDQSINGGIASNNMITVNKGAGIYICCSENIQILNNTIYVASDYPFAIEYKDDISASLIIENNLVNKSITPATTDKENFKNNITTAIAKWFKNVEKGDLHLVKNVPEVVNAAIYTDNIRIDIDGDTRRNYYSDIGADEK